MQALAFGKTIVGNSFTHSAPCFFTGVKNAPSAVTDDPATQVADSYGWVMGPDGYYWHYMMDIKKEFVRDLGDTKEYKYTGASVKIYDNNNKQVGAFEITVPSEMKCNQIQLYGPITKKLFDRNDKTYEIMVDLHHANNGEVYNVTRAYSIQSGDLLFDKRGLGIIFDASPNSYTVYQRLILTNEGVESNGILSNHVEIYKPGSWSSTGNNTVELDHDFYIPQNLCYYMAGTYFHTYKVDGQPYYVLSQYEQPWEDDSDGNNGVGGNVVQRKGNNLVLTTYDKNFTEVNSIKVNGDTPEGWNHRTLGFGVLGSNDFSKGFFTGDSQFNYVLVAYDYEASKGDYDFVSFYVYNSKGEKVKDIVNEASSKWWRVMSPVPGKEEQVGFLMAEGTGDAAVEKISLVDLPSCKQAALLPAQIDGNTISTTLDRKASSKNSYGYQYVVSLGYAETDADKNMISPIAWINPDATIDHKDAMNLGPNGQLFTPLLNDVTLNPYTFDTDEDMEYIYLAKKIRTDGSGKNDNVLEIAKADGTVIKSFESDEVHHLVQPAVVPVDGDGKYRLVVVYENLSTGQYEMAFNDLPFNKFAEGGDGTKAYPYMVATAGDLRLMGQGKNAYYKLANNIEMTDNGLWTPVDNFQGELDGDGYSLFNLYVNTDQARAGLFGNLGFGGHVKNLNFINPTVELTSNNMDAGVVAGSTTTDNKNGASGVKACENVHVLNGKIIGDNGATVGGLVGEAALYGHVVGSSFQGEINTPRASTVGGIVGATKTGSYVSACSSQMNATASDNLGGILGELSANCGTVYNCKSNGTLTAGNTVGGIVGTSNRTPIYNCVSNCDIKVSNPSSYAKYAAGGIVGYLEEDGNASEKTQPGSGSPVIYNNVMAGNIFVNGTKYNGTNGKENRVHMIAGSSSDDVAITSERYDDAKDEWVVDIKGYAVEDGLRNNYSATNLTSTTEATSTEGKYVAKSGLNKSFFQNTNNFSTTFAYGETVAAPWKGDGVPVLYFDENPKAITISAEDALIGLNEPVRYLKVVVYGVEDAEDIDAVSTNNNVAEVAIDKIEGNVVTLKITAKKTGVANIDISYDGLSTECFVTVVKEVVSGIENVETDNFAVKVVNGMITAEGAKSISVYSVGGKLMAQSNGSAIHTSQLTKGIYVVSAIDAGGHKSTAKFVLK